MKSLGEEISDDDVNEMIKEADPDKRGRVTYNVRQIVAQVLKYKFLYGIR